MSTFFVILNMVKDMTRTEKLLYILIVLVVSFIIFLFYQNFDKINKNINEFITSVKEPKINIPNDKIIYNRKYSYKTVHDTDNFSPKNIEDLKSIYYTVLNNGWDEFTFYCDKEYENCANDVKTIADDSEYINLINNYVSPYNSYKKYNTVITNNNAITLTIEKLYSNDEITNINAKLDNIFYELEINNTISNTNIKKLHDYLINNIKYDEDYKENNRESISNKAYGALFNGIALCSGYTDTLALMLDRLNIPNFKVTSEKHVWNVIYYDGKWTHIDSTWDDDEVNKYNQHNFYMISTDDLFKKDKEEHNFDVSDYLELN